MEINAIEQHKIDNITPDIYVDFICIIMCHGYVYESKGIEFDLTEA